MLHIYVYFTKIATLACSRSKRNAAEEEAAEGDSGCGRAGRQVGPGGGPAWAAPRCCHTLVNQHELASNEECTRTCRCRACWNGTEIACNPANWNGSGRNMHKYAKNMQLYVKKMHKICKYIDFIMQKICTKYARNMLKYASNMQIYANNL